MKLQLRNSDWLLNLMVAKAISTVVNLSYVLLKLVDQGSDPQRSDELVIKRAEEGTLSVSPDGYGYLIYDNGDSIYVSGRNIRLCKLQEGDRLIVDLKPSSTLGAHPVLSEVIRRNGAPFDYSIVYNQTSATVDVAVQLLYYLFLSFVMLMVLSATHRRRGGIPLLIRAALVVVVVGLYFVAPVVDWRTGRILVNFTTGRMFDYMVLLKWTYAVVVTLLYWRIYTLISQRQAVVVENERLKNENLNNRYNMLIGQINPHFFFNSLNSLAMLVREKQDERALTYIDQLSKTFRYIIQNGQSTLMSLDEELKFVEAYSYLFKIRYEDKLFFDIAIDPALRTWRLPALTLQPLIGNAVKHNTINRSNPFHVSIRTEGTWLVVSNPKIPKLTPEPSTGIGLNNLSSRWRLITGRDIEIVETEKEFTVRMPLQSPTLS